ncbi:MAG: TonB family protein [Pseudomonadota bacterium]
MAALPLSPFNASPRWGPKPKPGAMIAIVLLHLGLGWLLSQMPAVREAADHVAPLMVRIVSAERPEPVAAEPLPLPRVLHAPTPPVPLAVPTIEWTPTPPISAPVRPAAPVSEAVAVAPPAPPPTAPPAERQIAISQVEYLSPPQLLYPQAARRMREQGQVQVRVRVDEQGRTEQCLVLRSSGYARLDEAALATVRATRFKPYREDGVARPFWVVMPLVFELDT